MADATKSILKSKTFWVNVLSFGATYIPGLPIKPAVQVPLLAGVNILLRWVTKGPVSFIP